MTRRNDLLWKLADLFGAAFTAVAPLRRRDLASACTCMYNGPMRTTVEIDDAQRAELLKLAAQRGEKGFSSVIREAVDLYIRQHRAKKEAVAQALNVQGSFSDEEADALVASVRELRGNWR